ncbi:hypothetical protein ID856_05900 [Xenorhabdus sp. 18]|uniref:hypothetical protein n=1 Tax=Xenorhabdus doucetiae TaxID=351671 RepID=UPI0019BDF3B9|nr:hypothetical protein [Xenorhabdus sp. 18]MBD2796073.1 hypothetical protein [Xenorhabdus sp. 18]
MLAQKSRPKITTSLTVFSGSLSVGSWIRYARAKARNSGAKKTTTGCDGMTDF